MNLEKILDNSELLDEIASRADSEQVGAGLESLGPSDATRVREMAESWSPESAHRDEHLEAIVREHGRPVLFVKDRQIAEPSMEYWQSRLTPARSRLEINMPSIGRIEVENHPRLPWVGTGWLIAEDVIVTNRHVANAFGHRSDGGFVFRQNHLGRRMKAGIDTIEEHDSVAKREYRIREILHIEDDGGPDVAFLRVSGQSHDGDELPQPIVLSLADPAADQVVGVVGYAAADGRRNPGEAMGRIFGGIYNVKRLHPGEVMESPNDAAYFTHDCSTLGGNSGSVVLDFATGEAIGLHFAGSFLEQNYAVKASVVRERMKSVLGMSV